MAEEDNEYRVLALKYRPQIFQEVVGQLSVVRQLQGEIKDGRVGHAYLFTGPRGVGKTSMARIFAKALNCVNGPTPTPCGKCVHCFGIANDADMDVVEVDAATYTRKEETIELLEGIDRVAFNARYKVYIIDEVHMFSSHSFNVLLKRLEEPPPRVVFILATTNPEKIPDTVISRCRRLEFDRMETMLIVQRLTEIADRERITFAEGERERVLEAIALASEGGMRDSQVSLDQIVSLADGPVTYEHARQLLGVVESDMLHRLLVGVLERRTLECLTVVHEMVEKGRDLPRFIKTFTTFLRDAMMAKAGAPEEMLRVSRTSPEALRAIVAKASLPVLLNVMQQFLDLEEKMRSAAPPRFLLEFALLKLTAIQPTFVLDAMDPKQLRAVPLGSGASAGNAPAGASSAPAGVAMPEPPRGIPVAAAPADNAPRAQVGAGWSTSRTTGTPMMAAAPIMQESVARDYEPSPVLMEEEPPAVARVIDLGDQKRTLEHFQMLASEKLPALAGVIRDASLSLVGDNTLSIELRASDRIMKAQLDRPERLASLNEAARRVFGHPLRIRIQVALALSDAPESIDEPELMALQQVATNPPVTSSGTIATAASSPLLTFNQAMERFPDFQEAVDLVRQAFGSGPTFFNEERVRS